MTTDEHLARATDILRRMAQEVGYEIIRANGRYREVACVSVETWRRAEEFLGPPHKPPLRPRSEFLHARLLDESKQCQRCRVTTIRQGYVYYRPVDPDGKTRGTPGCFQVEDQGRWVKEVLT